ncbi:MAG: hypothetical protein HOD00_02865 [Gemmatimonadales bacterium]|nr:hypothetical protein [Gemmatimonadales bacterium]
MSFAGIRPSARSLGALCLVLVLTAAGLVDTLPDAAREGDAGEVRALLQNGADVNAAHADGMTALHWAAEAGHAEIAQILLSAGADAESVTRLGDYTPLHLAARNGHADVVKALLASGADANAATTAGGATALHFAASAGSVSSVESLLEAGASPNVRESSWGQTPLIFAAARGRTAAVEALLESGADPSLTSRVLDLPERYAEDDAAEQRRDEVLAEFRTEAGPDARDWRPTPSQVQAAVVAARAPVASPEEMAAAERALEARLELEAAGEAANPQQAPATQVEPQSFVQVVGTLGGMSALLHAVRDGHGVAAVALLDAGAGIDQASAGDGTTAVTSAVINGHFDLALELLDRGADPNRVNAGGIGPLFAALNTHWAPKARYPQQQAYRQQQATYLEVAEALLAAGADPNQRLAKHVWFMEYTFSQLNINMTGATPFWRAAHALDVEAMELLVAHGADPNIPTIKVPSRRRSSGGGDLSGLPAVAAGGPGVFPIHAASGHAYGSGYAGNSHRHVPDAWMPAIRYLVEEHGADVNTRDAAGYTPVHNAAARGDTEMIQYLVARGGDVLVVSRRGQTTADMANGPVQRIQPFPEAIALLVGLGAKNNFNCFSCQ